ncbi:MAG: Zn-dependent protease [Saliniramus fredricksonii]|jgi:Zn-dependent protease/CBS domain-containing protein|uniref:Zinc metalloprotease n=1 Tax=Saliniramus fredricksonii TaxID=1653334 RepID=A0A0N8KDK1_9HYPH|nr:site-2 protease family protein [Saliniramus fredricksonii]KPQ08762.1 MAG: Zn-dependent protease [Saliniramus fredricksonii]SCC78622.1 Zn-dependent protease (includes SpoIVFB) [Saliniramus fredricksonii]
MFWSIPIGVIAGTVVKLHITFILFLVWLAGMQWTMAGFEAALDLVILIVLIFACVVAHEFGHIFAARRYGIRTPEVILSPIGGIANLERMPDKPREELIVALAGPAVNVVIAIVLFFILRATIDFEDILQIENPAIGLAARLMAVNIILVVFNMIPAFPMDGGRVLRALLAMRMPAPKATRIAGRIGQAAAFAFAIIGLFWNPILIIIAVFVYLAASAEVEQTAVKDVAQGIRVEHAMVTVIETLPPGATLADAVEALVRTAQKEFPVVDHAGYPHGLMTRDILIPALAKGSSHEPVESVMMREVPTISAHAPLDDGMKRLMETRAPALFVLDRAGHLVGLLTSENIGEMVMVREMRPDWRFK